jgi:predicted glycosyl hydrolase (DUF1957 family)
MYRLATLARISAVIISLLYMLLLLPHVGSIETSHFSSPWFWGAVTVALCWIPILILHRQLDRERSSPLLALSFAPLILIAIFFGLLFANV